MKNDHQPYRAATPSNRSPSFFTLSSTLDSYEVKELDVLDFASLLPEIGAGNEEQETFEAAGNA